MWVEDAVERRRVLARVLASTLGRASAPVVIGRYALVDRLGTGGSGMVWSARDDVMGRTVAIKRVHIGAAAGRSEQVLREARALARLADPHVVQVFEVVRHGDDCYLVMQHVDGQPLHEWLAPGRPWRAVLAVLLDVAHGLAAAHARGLVHRDVKPGNVLVTREGRALVADFGIADHADAPTSDGTGTPIYMAPEQREHGPVDARADQYAFCVMAREALGGSDGAPRALDRVLRRGASAEPRRRFANMPALIAAVQHARTHRRLAAFTGLTMLGLLALCSASLGTGSPCEAASAGLLDEWHETRPAVRTRLAEVEEPWFVGRIDAAIDARASEIADAAVAACHAGATARVRCLDERIAEQLTLVHVLADRGPVAPGYGMRVAEAMPGAQRCDEDALLHDTEPPPLEIASRAQAIHRRGLRAQILELSGHPDDALAEARTALADAEALGHPRSEIAARFGLAIRYERRQRTDEAVALLERTYWQALEIGDENFAAKSALRLHILHGRMLADPTAGAVWARHARARLDRIGNPPHLEMEYEGGLAAIAALAGRYEEALPHAERACALLVEAGRANTLDDAWCSFNVASIQSELGQEELALATQLGVLALEEERFGPDHLELVGTLNNIARTELRLRRHADARGRLERALAIAERDLGPGHRQLAKLLSTSAMLFVAEGNRHEARSALTRARAIHAANGDERRRVDVEQELAKLDDAA